MTKSAAPAPDEHELQAYVEGALGAERRRAVERHLRANPREAERIAAYRAQKAVLAALLDDASASSPPRAMSSLAAALARKLEQQRRARAGFRSVVAASLLIAVAGIGWFGRGEYDHRQGGFASILTQQAAQGYRMYAGADGFADQMAGAEATDPFHWLAQRALGQNLVAPDLRPLDYLLVGGWVFPTQFGSAVQLLYRDGAGAVVTLYVVYGGAPLPESFSYAQDGDLMLLFWRSQNVGYCLAGRLGQPQLAAIAELVALQVKATATTPATAPPFDVRKRVESPDTATSAPQATAPLGSDPTVATVPTGAGGTMPANADAAPSGGAGEPPKEATEPKPDGTREDGAAEPADERSPQKS
jgi:anti-sigma factor RsiW